MVAKIATGEIENAPKPADKTCRGGTRPDRSDIAARGVSGLRAASGGCWFSLQARLRHSSPSDSVQPHVILCRDFFAAVRRSRVSVSPADKRTSLAPPVKSSV
jgi:hypothetical protein